MFMSVMLFTRSTINPGLSAVSTQSKLSSRQMLLPQHSCLHSILLLVYYTANQIYELTYAQDHHCRRECGLLCLCRSEYFHDEDKM